MGDKRVLIVDDDPACAELLGRVVELCGEEAQVAGDGQEALEMMRASRPNLVILDMLLPVVCGDEVLAIMRGDSELKDIPVIVMTVPAGFADAAVYDGPHVRKPLDTVEVMGLIRQILGDESGEA